MTGESQLAHYNLGLAFRRRATTPRRCANTGWRSSAARSAISCCRRWPRCTCSCASRPTRWRCTTNLLERQPDSPKLWNERGVALHQDGRVAEAEQSYRRALERRADVRDRAQQPRRGAVSRGAGDDAVEAFRDALDAQPTFVKARLNLALLLSRGKRFQLALEAYRQVLTTEPENPVAWNGIGLVLAELRKFEDARNAFARAIQARPDFAEAHYNMSFTLSNLGDFEGALRETKRALELDPYYVAQKFELAIDLEYEDPDLSIQPDLGGAVHTGEGTVEDFSFDPQSLDSLFTELAPAAPAAPQTNPAATRNRDSSPYAMAADYLSKGLYDRASAEISRAIARGADRADGLALLGDVFARSRACTAKRSSAIARRCASIPICATRASAKRGRSCDSGAARRRARSRSMLLKAEPEDVDVLMLAATACAEAGDPAAALDALDTARRVAPMRAEIQQKMGDIARSLGDNEGAIAAYRHALELDSDFAVVRFQLARLLQAKGQLREAEQELVAALDAVPTYAEATLELATLRRKSIGPAEALTLLIELLQRDPYHFDALIALGETLLALGPKARRGAPRSRACCGSIRRTSARCSTRASILRRATRYREAIDGGSA